MTIAKVLVPVTGAPRDVVVLAGGFAAARRFGAHLEALFVRPDPVEAMPFYGEGMSSAVAQEIMDVSKDAASRAAKAARLNLETALREAGDEPSGATGRQAAAASFREVEGNFADQVKAAARLADLIVFGAGREGDRPGLEEAFDGTLIEIGRPVLLASEHVPDGFAEKIAVAWNGSIASAHAASAAIPFLKQAAAVEILTVRRANTEPESADQLCAYLSLHGISATSKIVEGGERPIADVLLKAATASGATLLVAGGYGHNRLRELFVTGTTRRVIAQAAIPCFLVH
ncbi:MAG: universal stress protein [Alphaproteobacteria bacterium]|nr:universal stress protein [Alphaproteobacteria bacterium]